MEVLRPTAVEGVLDALAAAPGALLLAGGTDVMVECNAGLRDLEKVISLRRVDELRVWDGGFLGAGVTYQDMLVGPSVGLAELARTVGSPPIRNAGTIGGNLGTASPAGDTLPFVAAVDGEVVLRSAARGERSLPWDRFLIGPKRTAREPDELIVGLRLPDRLPSRQAFGKVGPRTAMVISVVSVVVTRDHDGRVTVALGAVGPTVLRATAAERFATGMTSPTPDDLVTFAKLVRAAVLPIDDHRSSAAYRRHAAGVLATRLLERVLI